MKFLKKKPVKIGLIVASVLMLVLIIAFCARPVSVGYTYSGKIKMGDTEMTLKYHFNSFDKMTGEAKTENTSDKSTIWYFTKGGYLITSEEEVDKMEKDDFKKYKEAYIENWETYEKGLEKYGSKVNAFTITMGDETLVCGGAIATVVILAVVELGLVALTVMSFLSKKK